MTPAKGSGGSTRPGGARGALRAMAIAALLGLASGCTTPSGIGTLHTVRPGENLYRIALYYEVSVTEILAANAIDDPRDIAVGTRLEIPRTMRPQPRRSLRPPAPGAVDPLPRERAQADALVAGNLRFGWPVRGRLSSRFGRRWGRPHEGIDLAAPTGTLVRASEAGRVIHSGWLGDYGRVVILEHRGRHTSVYAHLSSARVKKGAFVDHSAVIGEVGSTGNSTGPHLHFEIRRDEEPVDPLLLLP